MEEIATEPKSITTPESRCARCGGGMLIVHELGRDRHRCPNGPCENARRHRRDLQNRSYHIVKLGPIPASQVDALIEEKRAYYAPGGAGWPERRDEALRILRSAGSLAEAADAVLMQVNELRQALQAEGVTISDARTSISKTKAA